MMPITKPVKPQMDRSIKPIAEGRVFLSSARTTTPSEERTPAELIRKPYWDMNVGLTLIDSIAPTDMMAAGSFGVSHACACALRSAVIAS